MNCEHEAFLRGQAVLELSLRRSKSYTGTVFLVNSSKDKNSVTTTYVF